MERSYYKILEKIEENGFVAYIVGGYVRDKILGVSTSDIDIITNATPKDLNMIFKTIKKTYLDYGAVKLYVDNHIIDITTFRKEYDYVNNKPSKIEYISSLEEDLKRRDFLMNTLVMDKEENIIDLLGGKKDILNRVISPVKNVDTLFKEDASRMLRALRFRVCLDFKLDNTIFEYILSNKELFKSISSAKKKFELDKILRSSNSYKFFDFIKKYDLESSIGVSVIDKFVQGDVITSYACLNIMCDLSFTKLEKEQISLVKKIVSTNKLDIFDVYKYGLYISMCAGEILGISKEKVNLMYTNLPIKSIMDLDISSEEVMSYLGIGPGKELGIILNTIEMEVVSGKLKNRKVDILERLGINYE